MSPSEQLGYEPMVSTMICHQNYAESKLMNLLIGYFSIVLCICSTVGMIYYFSKKLDFFLIKERAPKLALIQTITFLFLIIIPFVTEIMMASGVVWDASSKSAIPLSRKIIKSFYYVCSTTCYLIFWLRVLVIYCNWKIPQKQKQRGMWRFFKSERHCIAVDSADPGHPPLRPAHDRRVLRHLRRHLHHVPLLRLVRRTQELLPQNIQLHLLPHLRNQRPRLLLHSPQVSTAHQALSPRVQHQFGGVHSFADKLVHELPLRDLLNADPERVRVRHLALQRLRRPHEELRLHRGALLPHEQVQLLLPAAVLVDLQGPLQVHLRADLRGRVPQVPSEEGARQYPIVTAEVVNLERIMRIYLQSDTEAKGVQPPSVLGTYLLNSNDVTAKQVLQENLHQLRSSFKNYKKTVSYRTLHRKVKEFEEISQKIYL